MFAFDTSFNEPRRSKSGKSSRLAASLCFHQKHTDVGNAGERLAIAMLQDAGFVAYKTGERYDGDIHAKCPKTGELSRIEVKTSRYSSASRKWQFCLKKAKHTDCQHSDYVFFILIDKSRVFTYLVPTSFLGNTRSLEIHSHPEKYRGKIAPFRNHGSLSFQAACNTMALKSLQ